MFDITHKSILVTGAAAGIGRAMTLLFSARGARVVASDRDGPGLRRLADEVGNIIAAEFDVTDPSAIQRVVSEVGHINVLVNCAGVVTHGSLLDGSREDWLRAFNINVTSMFDMMRAVVPGMIKLGGGSIINIASVVSTLKAAPNRCAYAASKAAVIALSKSVALDYITKGIRSNSICPGTVDTPSLSLRIAAAGDAETTRKAFVARQPMGRLGSPEEIAAAALYLASDESAFMTGQEFVIDGGFSL